jgi:membrane-bound lytic murein transglycosylase D
MCTALSIAAAQEPESATSLEIASAEVPSEGVSPSVESVPAAEIPNESDASEAPSGPQSLRYDIPMPWGHELFEKYRQFYLSDAGRKILCTTMEKAMPFMDYIQTKVAEYGVPQELAYLPVIESAFSPFAVSRSGATGIWQFMRNSIKGYGMAITDWVDDRRDFMKSTDAALNKLVDNYETLQDWPLAIAAYNAGLGTVSRALNANNGSADFWAIYEKGLVSKQAMDYVPKFLAVASILRYPELYNLEIPSSTFKWDTISLDRQVDIKLLAAKAEIPLDMLKLGNAELHYTVTPPESEHILKIPADKTDQVKEILSDPNAPLVRYEIYKVKEGDTLTAIAKRYSVSISMIAKVNGRMNPDSLKIGQKLMIPLSLQPLNGAHDAQGTQVAATKTHTVQKGDTLYSLGRRYGTTAQKLASLNGISLDSILRVGQTLKIPASP